MSNMLNDMRGTGKLYIEVPYEFRYVARMLGATWDKTKKMYYITNQMSEHGVDCILHMGNGIKVIKYITRNNLYKYRSI